MFLSSRTGQTRRRAFTLVELLIVVAIIAVLVGILLPSLARARNAAWAVQCAANLRSIGQAFQIYMADSAGCFPAAYTFNCNNYYPGPGITHWARLVHGGKAVGEQSLMCPAFDRGGLPPTDRTEDNREAGQVNKAPCVDLQAARCACTVMEALCPQPFFRADPPPRVPMGMCHYVGATNIDLHDCRLYRTVRSAEVARPSSTILASEWHQNRRMVSGPGYSNAASAVSLSYRPVHGFAPVSGGARDPCDLRLIAPISTGSARLRRLSLGELAAGRSRMGPAPAQLAWPQSWRPALHRLSLRRWPR